MSGIRLKIFLFPFIYIVAGPGLAASPHTQEALRVKLNLAWQRLSMQYHWTIQDSGSLATLRRQEYGPPQRPAHFTQIPRVSISRLDPTSSVWKQILEPVQRQFKLRLEIFSARVCGYADSIAAKVFENPTLVHLDCLCPSIKLPKASCTLLCL